MQATLSPPTGYRAHNSDEQQGFLPDPIAVLDEISRNFWWSWAADGAAVFRDLDAHLWETTEQNPRRVLREISELRLLQRANDPHFTARVAALKANFDRYMSAPKKSFQGAKAVITEENPAAYFCAEYGVHNSLPLYSGGLGILAGDHLKSASDVNVPLVAVGLFYRFGYFRQQLSSDGLQMENYQESLPSNLAIAPVYDADGNRLKISVEMRGHDVFAQIWRVDVGRVPLYLLDTHLPENLETDRWITGHLYGGDTETRVVQEMMLGIGGVRLLRKLGIEPAVYHLNEGHSAFLTLELVREKLAQDENAAFADAQAAVREKCVFTTHTPVAAGNDEFSPEVLEKCFGENYFAQLRLNRDEFFAAGRIDSANQGEWFGMTPFSIRMCRSANGVSEKHGAVSRQLWSKMFPSAWSTDEVPITSVTNGVHAPTWIAPAFKAFYEEKIGADWQEILQNQQLWTEKLAAVSDEEIWRTHNLLKQQLIAYTRFRTYQARHRTHEPSTNIEEAWHLFDPNVLTIGFARRVAAYKRWNLLLAQPERLLALIDNAERPVQFIFAGKAHPQDIKAKHILQELIAQKSESKWARRAIFLQDYEQDMARYLVQGVDVWLNVPRRPLEASGTSGQKAAMNGGLNFSILDGWWIEGYNGANGFAIGTDGADDKQLSDEEIDCADADSLYDVLENQIVPAFYERDAQNLPNRWTAMMRSSLATLTTKFSSDRMVLDYINHIYT